MRKKYIALLACLLLMLAACGPTGTQSGGVTVRYGMSSAWDGLMPYNSVSGSNYARIVYDKIYDRLAYVSADGTLLPRGADTWESADGGKAIVFHLSQTAAFHDGTPVTAEHWAETFRLMTEPDCPTLGRANFSLLIGTDETGVRTGDVGAEALDAGTLKLTFKLPTTPEDFLVDKNREFYVLPTHLLEGVPPKDLMGLDLWRKPIGSGPCLFGSEIVGSQLTLTANQKYQLGAPGFDTLVMTVMDKSNLLTALISDDLDYYAFGGNITVEDAEVAQGNGLTVLEGTVPNTFYELMLNNETISSAWVRNAIDVALDKELLCQQSTQGLGEPTYTSITPTSPWYPNLEYATQRNLALAQQWLEGEYDGQVYTLACTSNRAGLAALMQQNLAEAGIQVEIETVDSATLFAGMSQGIYDMAIASHTPTSLPLWFTESRLNQQNNLFHIPDLSQYTQLISDIKQSPTTVDKLARVQRLESYLVDQRPFIPLWFGRALHVQSPTVGGIDYASSSFSNENVWDWTKQ